MKLSDTQADTEISAAREAMTAIFLVATTRSDDPEQQFQMGATLAAAIFGMAGGLFQSVNPSVSKDEAARATLAHIGSLLGAYTN